MARNYSRGIFTPQNLEKYQGSALPVWRSSWERDFMNMLDLTETVLSWSSESVRIPYRNPLTGRQTIYIPDFLVRMIENGKPITKLIEIKPISETFESHAANQNNALAQLRNRAKWGAAIEWCNRRSTEDGSPVIFEIMTEADLFVGGKNIAPAKRPVAPINMIGTLTKKSLSPAKPKRVKSPLQIMVEKARASRAAAGHTGFVKKPRTRKSAKVRRAGPVRRIRPL